MSKIISIFDAKIGDRPLPPIVLPYELEDARIMSDKGKVYRLVECDHVRPMPDSSAPQLHD